MHALALTTPLLRGFAIHLLIKGLGSIVDVILCQPAIRTKGPGLQGGIRARSSVRTISAALCTEGAGVRLIDGALGVRVGRVYCLWVRVKAVGERRIVHGTCHGCGCGCGVERLGLCRSKGG